MARHRGSVHEAPLRQLVCHMELLIVFLRQHIGAGRTSLVYKAPMLRGSVRVSFWPSSHTGTGPREVLRGRARSRQRVARACHTRLRFRGCGLAGKWRRWRMWTKSQSTAWRCMILWTTDSAFKQQTAQTVGHGFAILRSEDSCRVSVRCPRRPCSVATAWVSGIWRIGSLSGLAWSLCASNAQSR